MTGAERTGTLVDWKAEREALRQVIAPAMRRSEARPSAGMFFDGLFSAACHKTGSMLAEQAGLNGPHRLQSLLGRTFLVGRPSPDRLRQTGQNKSSRRRGMTVPLATPEIRHLRERRLFRAKTHPAFVWAWTRWRRNHQATTATSHRKKQRDMQP